MQTPRHVRPNLAPALRGVLAGALLAVSTVTLTLAMVPPALLKLLLPFDGARRVCDRALTALAAAWVALNNRWIVAVRDAGAPEWDVRGLEGLDTHGWYLVSSNHQSWVDILVLQRVFHGRIPFLKFFLKKELMWVPVIGLAWWALDFPFMKRGQGAGARHSDLATTRAACRKFKRIPTSVINFVEGTRFTPAKHERQRSPYTHLLKPKIGGLGIALATMGEMFTALLDVTIVYPDGTPTFSHLLTGRIGRVVVRVQARPIPADVLGGDPIDDAAYRQRLAAWMEAQWREKDALIAALKAGGGPA
ncbi:MAG: acyltransferase [Leptothrix sp. (in: Bacteria)]|nr:acyltransferase [Leptothrix sp. (in: b-proteobacteria)]